MIPAIFAIVPALPLTVNGKVDRRALLANQVESKVIGRESNLTTNSSIESNLDESQSTTSSTAKISTADILVAIWSQVLGRPQVGIDDNFFELGGHSISILQVAAAVRSEERRVGKEC